MHLFFVFLCVSVYLFGNQKPGFLVRHYDQPCYQEYIAQKQEEVCRRKLVTLGMRKDSWPWLILQAQRIRFSPGVGLGLSGLLTHG